MAHPGPVRVTAQGLVRGCSAEVGPKLPLLGGALEGQRYHAFHDIPFAVPPVGPLRWRAPRPHVPWQGERDCSVGGGPLERNPCVAPSTGAGPVMGESPMMTGSEDCLYLDILAPAFDEEAVPTGSEARPVLVSIFAGGNTRGSKSGTRAIPLVVREGLIVVSPNYRLGLLGNFTHRAIRETAENEEDKSANFGLLDLVSAIRWVRSNISSFGGDPARITAIGCSAGGHNAALLSTCPLAKGLLAAVVADAPFTWANFFGSLTPEYAEHGPPWKARRKWGCLERTPTSVRLQESTVCSDEVVARALVVAGHARDITTATNIMAEMTASQLAEFLRSLDVGLLVASMAALDERLAIGEHYANPRRNAAALVADGVSIPSEGFARAFATGASHCPVMLGCTAFEMGLFYDLGCLGTSGFPKGGPVFSWSRPEHGPAGKAYAAQCELSGQMAVLQLVRAPAQKASSAGAQVFPFVYTYVADKEPGKPGSGATHTSDITKFFGGVGTDAVDKDGGVQLAEAMMSYLANFCHDKSPGRGRQGNLPLWEAGNRPMLFRGAVEAGPLAVLEPATAAPPSFAGLLKQVLAEGPSKSASLPDPAGLLIDLLSTVPDVLLEGEDDTDTWLKEMTRNESDSFCSKI